MRKIQEQFNQARQEAAVAKKVELFREQIKKINNRTFRHLSFA